LDDAYPDPVLAQHVQLEYEREERVQYWTNCKKWNLSAISNSIV